MDSIACWCDDCHSTFYTHGEPRHCPYCASQDVHGEHRVVVAG